jgi:hypothetical protein
MMGIRLSQVIVSLSVMALAAATGFGQEIHDDFNNGVLDSAWTVRFTNANGWTYSEAGTNLTVTDIAATVISHDGMALIPSEVMLARQVAPLGDFQADMSFSWSSTQSGYEERQALQKVLLRLMGPAGQVVAFCGYSDPWIHFSGSRYWNFGGATGYGAQGSEPYAGSATVAINRVGSDIQMLWNGQPFVSGTNSTPVTEVQVFFSYFPFDGGGGPSFFGTESVDSINVTPEPATLAMLAVGGLAMLRRRRRR